VKRLKLGVLASGGGSNLQSIIDKSVSGELDAEVVIVISNNSKAGALERAKKHGIEAMHISAVTEGSEENVDSRIVKEMLSRDIDIVILAGYMKKIGHEMLSEFKDRIINIHPALLPKFGGEGMYGMNVHRAVIASGEKESGPTVHLVNEQYDKGKIIAQEKVAVYTDDTPEILQKRVLEIEHKIYPEAIQRISENWKQ